MRNARTYLAASLLPLLVGCRCNDKDATIDLRGVDRSDGRLPRLEVSRFADKAMRVDGKLDEAAWRSAAHTGAFVGPGDGKPVPDSPVNGSARLGWTERYLYVGFVVYDANPTTPFSRDDVDPHLWEKASAVELMIQPGDPGDNRFYYEIQVDTAGAVWDTRFDDYNRPITGAAGSRRFGHQDWKSGIERAAKIASGKKYTIELAIPWSNLSNKRSAAPPKPNDVWRINLYSFRDGQRAALAWSPTLRRGNFHKSSRFGRVVFVN